MIDTQGELFDSKKFVGDERFLLHDKLGTHVDQFLNASRYILLSVTPNATGYFHSYDDDSTTFSSTEYAENESIGGALQKGIFSHWSERKINREYTGFIAGFPRIHNGKEGREKKHDDTVHIWYDNSDIIPSSTAIPFRYIESMIIFSERVSDLRVELDLLAARGVARSARFQRPLYRDTRTGETVFVGATTDEIEDIIEHLEHEETPVLTHGYRAALSVDFNVRSLRELDDEEIATLL